MLERLARSWSLVKASAAIVRSNKALLVFPCLSGLATVAVVLTFLVPLARDWGLEGAPAERDPVIYVWLLLLYVALYFVSLFFNTALVSVALLRLSGNPAGLRDGLARAIARLPAIVGYALLAASVGLLLRIVEERVGWIGRITAALIGVTWTVVTFLVVPCLAAQRIGPIEAVSQSAALLKRTWGENIAGNVGIGFVFTLIYVLIALGTIALMTAALPGSPGSLVAIVALAIVLSLATAAVHATLQGVYSAALYCYATLGEAAPGFSAEALGGAFRHRKP